MEVRQLNTLIRAAQFQSFSKAAESLGYSQSAVTVQIKALEDKFDDDTESIITNERYVYISSIIGDCVTKNKKNAMTTSDKIDRIVTNRWLALPIFAVVMWVVYYVSVTTVGTFVTDWTNDVLFGEIIPPAIENLLNAIHCADWLQGLILDGIVAGVGAVLGFVPQMLVLFCSWHFWSPAVTWRVLHSSWTVSSVNLDFPENPSFRC